MSKGIRSIASIALPIVGNFLLPGIGGVIGGALGGALSGGGLTGAAMGALGGYASAGMTNGLIGNIAGAPLAQVAGNAALQGPTYGSGLAGAFTGGGLRALTSGVGGMLTSAASDPSKWLLSAGNMLTTQDAANTAEKAARIQSGAIDRAMGAQAPYTQLGQDAVKRIGEIQADPSGYVANNPFYTSLAKDAERRLLANQAAKGKVGSGGTAAALQDQLLQIGNGLVGQEIGRLQQQAGIGQNSAGYVSDALIGQGNANASGVVGRQMAYRNGYEEQLRSLLAMNNAPMYQPNNRYAV